MRPDPLRGAHSVFYSEIREKEELEMMAEAGRVIAEGLANAHEEAESQCGS